MTDLKIGPAELMELTGWASVKGTSIRDVAIAGIAMALLMGFFYLRRGEVCLVPGLVLTVIFPFIVLTLEYRLNSIVWHDEWRKFKRPEAPVDQVIEGLLEETGLAFEREGPWKPIRSFKFTFEERFHIEDGTRVSYRGEWEHHVYVGPADKAAEVGRLKGLIDGVLEPFK